jgi:hypothetical protein
MMISNVKQLRAVLLTDAATCLASGLLLSLMPSQLAALLQLPGKLLFYAGLSLFPIAAFIALTATRRAPAPSWVWLIIAGNAAWIAGSLWLALGTLVEPNSLGVAYLIAQAVVVSILTWLEYQGLEHLESSPDETAQPSR